jgi:lambda family phage portal protein
MIGEALDRLIGVMSPGWGLRRVNARATMQQIQEMAGSQGGYDAGKLNRFTKLLPSKNVSENEISTGQLDRLRAASWNLYRNNPHARKIVRQLEAKVIGTGMRPHSQATHADGKVHVEFRDRAHQVWEKLARQLDYRGKPGRGGQHFTNLTKSALRTVILSGDVLYRGRFLTVAKQEERRLALPFLVQLISPDLLDESLTENRANANQIFRGIEFDGDEQRVAYWFEDDGPPTRIPAVAIGHLFVSDDINQARGVPWFAPALLQIRDTGDYQYNELKAAAMGACVVLGYKRPRGVARLGVNSKTGDTTDDDDNKVTSMQPGMILDLGDDGKIDGFNPQRPNTNAEAFIQHLLRVTATAFPGVKGSSLTGDYRRSSFSSERSADNEMWPEIEGVQQWFSSSLLQPIYELVIAAAVVEGLFDDVKGFSPSEFLQRKEEYLAAEWQGPVSRSINPTDDSEASDRMVRNLQSTPQIEAAKRGLTMDTILKQVKEIIDQARANDIPDAIINQMFGVDSVIGAAPIDATPATLPGTPDPQATGETGADTEPRSVREEYERELAECAA